MTIVNRVRKGDIVAVERRHSELSLIHGHRFWTTWSVAMVASARRDGTVRAVLPYPLAVSELTNPANVLVLNELVRDAGRRIFERQDQSNAGYATQEALRAALRAEAGIDAAP
jgi:hypothetical protein